MEIICIVVTILLGEIAIYMANKCVLTYFNSYLTYCMDTITKCM